MRDFIVRRLKMVQGTTPEEIIGNLLNLEQIDDPKVVIDINDFPRIIRDHSCWVNAFGQQFGFQGAMDIRGMTSVIADSRKFWAHPGADDLDSESTRTYLSLVADVVGGINEPGLKEAVESIRDQLFSDEVEEHPAEVENAALKENLADMTKQLDAAEAERSELEDRLKEVEAEWIASEERLETVSAQLKVAVAENAELKKCLSETENRLRTVESEKDEHIKTLTERPRTVEAEKTILEERPKNSPKQPEIKEWRRKIWKQLCDYAAQKDTPVRFHKPGSENYLNVSRSLIALIGFNMKVWLGRDNREIAIRLYMSKQNFYILEKQRKEIEQEFCESLEWEKLPQRSDSRISLRKDIIDPTDESDWQNQLEWVISKLEKFHKKFNEVFLPRIQELNTSNSLSEDEEDLPLNPATLDSVTFQGTTFTKRLNKYRVEGDEITQTFWHYWHSQGVEGKREMRDAGWSVKKVNGDWEVVISPEDFESWIEDEESWDEADEDNAFSNEVYTES